MKPQITVHSPEPKEESYAGPVEAHIIRKYNKFHAHVMHHDGSEHHMAPAASFHEAHAAIGEHIGRAMPHNPEQNAEEPLEHEAEV